MALIGLAKIRKIIRIHLEKTKTNVIGELRNIKFTLTNWSFDGNDLTWRASRVFFKCFIANITKEDGAWDDVLSFLSSDPGLIYSWSVNRFAYIFVCFFFKRTTHLFVFSVFLFEVKFFPLPHHPPTSWRPGAEHGLICVILIYVDFVPINLSVGRDR